MFEKLKKIITNIFICDYIYDGNFRRKCRFCGQRQDQFICGFKGIIWEDMYPVIKNNEKCICRKDINET